jgi:fatty-acyl-CoA synthase
MLARMSPRVTEGRADETVPVRFDPVARWAACDGNRLALLDPARGERLTYRALDHLIDRWAGALHWLGARAGDRVAVLAGNRSDLVALLFAAHRLGASLVPLNWRLTAVELARVLADASPSVLLGEARYRATAETAIAAAAVREPVWCDLDHDAPAALGREPAPQARDAALDDVAMLLYTSGSTGGPKGVVMPHRQLHWNALATTASWRLSAADIAAVATPLFHTAGWGVFLLPLLHAGGRLVLFDRFDPDGLLATMRAEHVTVAFGVPTQYELLRASRAWGEPLPALRWWLSGGAPCPRRLHEAVWEAGYRFREGYGLTECGPNCFTTTNALARARPGTVGRPVQHLRMRLAGERGAADAGEGMGELELSGPQLFSGYFNAPERTAEVMTEDGWLRTGDIVQREADGIMRVRGRRTEMFISGGENVFPGEVEAALLTCRGVAEVSVLGVPDPLWGEVGCAVVVPAPGGAPVLAADILAEVRSRLAAYKVPRDLRFIDALPRLGSGKIDRRAVAGLIQPPPGGASRS